MAKSLKRSFEFDDGNSHKFWEISLDGDNHTVRFGRVGTNGTTKTKVFESEAKAEKDAERLIKSKLKKGYEETGSSPEPLPKQEKKETNVKQTKTGKMIVTNKDKLFVAASDFETYQLKVTFLQKNEEAYAEVLDLMVSLVRSANRKKKHIHNIDFQFIFDREETYLEGGLPRTSVNHFFCEAVKFETLHKKLVSFFNAVAGKDYWYGEFGSGGESICLGMYVSAALALHQRRYTGLLRDWFRQLDWGHHSIQLEIVEPVFNKYKDNMTDIFMGVIVASMLSYNSRHDLPVNVQHAILEDETNLFLFLKQVKVEISQNEHLDYQDLIKGLFLTPNTYEVRSQSQYEEVLKIFETIKHSKPLVIASMMDAKTEMRLKEQVRLFFAPKKPSEQAMAAVDDPTEQALAAVKEIETNFEHHAQDPQIAETYAEALRNLSNCYLKVNNTEEATKVVARLKHIAENFNRPTLTQSYFTAFFPLFQYHLNHEHYDQAIAQIDELLVIAEKNSQFAILYQGSIAGLSQVVHQRATEIQQKEGLGQSYYDHLFKNMGVLKKFFDMDDQEEEKGTLMELINNFLVATLELGKIAEGLLVAETFQKFGDKNAHFFHSAACLSVADKQFEQALTQLEQFKKHHGPLTDTIKSDQNLKPLFEQDRFQALFS